MVKFLEESSPGLKGQFVIFIIVRFKEIKKKKKQ